MFLPLIFFLESTVQIQEGERDGRPRGDGGNGQSAGWGESLFERVKEKKDVRL